MSHSLLWRHIVLLTVGVYSSNHGGLYTIGINVTRRFQKSVGPSVCLSVCNANNKAYSSIVDSRVIVHIPGEMAHHPLQENEAVFKKNVNNFRPKFRNILYLSKMSTSSSLLTIE